MRITVDTNVLIRAVIRDDPKQARQAIKALSNADLIAVTLPCLCEFVWVLRKIYDFQSVDAALAIRTLIASVNVVVNRAAVEAGLTILDAGGDFADGVIAYEGNWLGAETFVSFDKKAIALLKKNGHIATFPAN